MGQQASGIPLFRAAGQRPMEARGARFRQAWLLRVRRALAFRKEWLEMMRERLDLLEESLAAEIEEEAERERPRRRPQPGARPGAETPPVESAPSAERETPSERRHAVLEAVFEEMQGHEEEFLQDGRPRVESVNTRLSARGEAEATRREISEAFDAWKRRQESESSC